MATMRPTLSEAQLLALPSRAEARFYEACRDLLPASALVLHSTAWVYKSTSGRVREGEADFLLVLPEAGIVVVEVKGGGVSFDAKTAEWYSVDRNGARHEIKDPFRQAAKERFAVRDQLVGHPKWHQWSGRRLRIGHSVFLPDVEDVAQLANIEHPREIIGCRRDLPRLAKWLRRANVFWADEESDPLGAQGLRLVEDILCSSIEVRPVLCSFLEDAETQRIRLTERQAKILRVIGGRKRAIIAGGAGTGKTLIAVEKARRLAAQECSVLLLCYNQQLANTLSVTLQSDADIHPMSFHQLCERRTAEVYRTSQIDLMAEAAEAYPGESEKQRFEVQMPFALARSNEILDDRYDAVIVDEAQDFSDEYWFAIEELLRDPEGGYLYLFLDPNQALYRRHANLPIKDEPFFLTANCRNTTPIHDVTYRFYEGEPVDRPDLPGPAVETLCCESDSDQAAAIGRRCGQLLTTDKVAPEDVTVLLAKRPKNQMYDLLERIRLPNGEQWAFESPGRRGVVLVDTVARFKGLESAVVLLWLGDEVLDARERETIYVGTSRAKSLLVGVGSKRACAALSPGV